MIIMLDLDGVITDFVPALLEQYNYLTGEEVSLADIKSNDLHKHIKNPAIAKRIKDGVGFIRNLKPTIGSLAAVRKIVACGHTVLFVSCNTNCPTSAYEKREWLNFYFKGLWDKAPLIMTPPKLKHFVRGDVLVDDDPQNLAQLVNTKPLLWNQTYNTQVTGFERINGWDELFKWIEENKG